MYLTQLSVPIQVVVIVLNNTKTKKHWSSERTRNKVSQSRGVAAQGGGDLVYPQTLLKKPYDWDGENMQTQAINNVHKKKIALLEKGSVDIQMKIW